MTLRADTLATRQAIITTAERLFATHSIDAVSLGQICRGAGQRNHSAVQYHFGNKREILRAILNRHVPGIDRQRVQRLIGSDDARPPRLRQLVEILVLPVAEKLDDTDGGKAFLQISAQLVGHPTYSLLEFDDESNLEGRRLLAAQIVQHLPELPVEVLMARRMLIVSLLFHSLADISRQLETTPIPKAVFLSNLVDTIVALLEAPASDATRTHLTGSRS